MREKNKPMPVYKVPLMMSPGGQRGSTPKRMSFENGLPGLTQSLTPRVGGNYNKTGYAFGKRFNRYYMR